MKSSRENIKYKLQKDKLKNTHDWWNKNIGETDGCSPNMQ